MRMKVLIIKFPWRRDIACPSHVDDPENSSRSALTSHSYGWYVLAWQRRSHNGHFDSVNSRTPRHAEIAHSAWRRQTRRKRSSERHTITRFYDAASSTCNWKSIPERFRQSRRAYVKNFIIPRNETNTYAENAEKTMERNGCKKNPGGRGREEGDGRWM